MNIIHIDTFGESVDSSVAQDMPKYMQISINEAANACEYPFPFTAAMLCVQVDRWIHVTDKAMGVYLSDYAKGITPANIPKPSA